MTPERHQQRIETRTKGWVGEPFIMYLKAEPKEIFASGPNADNTFRYQIRDNEVMYRETRNVIECCRFETSFDVDNNGIIMKVETVIKTQPIKRVKQEKGF